MKDEWVPYRIRFPWTIDEPSVETVDLGREACRRAQRILDAWTGDPLPGAIASSRVVVSLQARPRTQVLAVEAPRDRDRRFVLKVHTELESFCRELVAMRLLGGADESSLSARIIAVDEAAQALLIEYIEDAVKLRSASDFDAACRFIGHVHRSLQEFSDVLESDLGFSSARELLTSRPVEEDEEDIDPAGAHRERWLRRACEHLADLFGDEIVFCHVGDIKPGHVRRRSGGDWALIDLESLGGPVPQTLDLVALLNLVVSDAWVCPVSTDDWLRGCASYLAATRPRSPSGREAEHLLEAIQFTAAAFDLQAMLPDPRT